VYTASVAAAALTEGGIIMKTDVSINARFDAWSVNHKDGFARLSYQRIALPNSTIMKGLAPPGA